MPLPSDADAPRCSLEATDVAVRYGDHVALDGVSFRLECGERLAVVGPNGAGKTTLFRVIAGLTAPSSGTLTVHGHAPGIGVCVAYVPQRNEVDWSFPVTVADVTMMGRVGRIGMLRRPGALDRARVRECLGTVGLTDLAERQIGALSGGQQQRMFIARALAQEAELVLMDEPLTGLDAHSRQDILDVLADLRRRGVSVMVATHDLALAAEHFDRVLLLNHHPIAWGATEDVLTPSHLLAAYGDRVRFIDPGHDDLAPLRAGGGQVDA
jgi:manganese/iron transport system ATP-binding protein